MNPAFSPVASSASASFEGKLPIKACSEGGESTLENLAHEIRQPLSVIESLAYYLELTSKDQGACVHLQRIQSMVRRASGILSEAVGR